MRPGNLLAKVGLLILRGIARLPIQTGQQFGKALGTIAWALFPFRKNVGLTNLQLCFPEMENSEHHKLLRAHYQAMGMGIYELAVAWYRYDLDFNEFSTVQGIEILEKLRNENRGVLLVSAHFTTLEIMGRILIERFPFGCLYRKPNQPVIAEEMTRCRIHHMQQVIHFNSVPELIRALRSGACIWYAPDQAKRLKDSALLPFFGEPAVTNTATKRIAEMGRASLVPYFGHRNEDGTYHIEIQQPLEISADKSAEDVAREINQLIETNIRRAPEQYFWLHKRFKRRGVDYPDVYAH